MLEDQQPSKSFEEFFDRIKDIFKKSIEEKGLEEEPKITPVEFNGFHIDLPRKQKDMYHGSSYEILCNRPKTWCKIKGDLVTEEDYDYEAVKALEDSDCKSHLHFI